MINKNTRWVGKLPRTQDAMRILEGIADKEYQGYVTRVSWKRKDDHYEVEVSLFAGHTNIAGEPIYDHIDMELVAFEHSLTKVQ